MNTIQSNVVVGAPMSVMRAKTAVDNGLVVCSGCYAALEFATAVGAFDAKQAKIADRFPCYMCEHTIPRGGGFKVFRVATHANP